MSFDVDVKQVDISNPSSIQCLLFKYCFVVVKLFMISEFFKAFCSSFEWWQAGKITQEDFL